MQNEKTSVLPNEPTVTITVPLAEALAVGHSLRSIAASKAFPGSETARIYRSVGDAMVKAGHTALMAQRAATAVPK